MPKRDSLKLALSVEKGGQAPGKSKIDGGALLDGALKALARDVKEAASLGTFSGEVFGGRRFFVLVSCVHS